MSNATTRINKFLAHAHGMSRREADDAIASGHVTINGQLAQIGSQVTSSDTVMLDGKALGQKTHYTYLLFYKPVNYICSRRRQGETSTIYELLPEQYRTLKPVGRLDKDSSGILLLTDDGDFAHTMTHPKFYKTKIYEVALDRPLAPLHQQMVSDMGVQLNDGRSQFLIERTDGSEQGYRVTMHEGRNRQIRRTFAALGYTVTRLHRTTFGNYSLGDMKPGDLKKVYIHPVI